MSKSKKVTRNFKKNKSNRRRRLQKARLDRVKFQIHFFSKLIISTKDITLKRKYVKIIRAISQKVQFTVPNSVKFTYCRRCSEVFTLDPIQTFTVRLRNRKIVFTCKNCGYIRRKSYQTQKKLINS